MLIACLAGIVLGFIGSVPIAGPISALVLERTLAGQPKRARGIGIGAAVAEAAYATLAFIGMGEVITRFPNLMAATKLLGVVVLLVVAALLLRQRDASLEGTSGEDTSCQEPTHARAHGVATGFTIAILNPTLIATWSTTTATLFASGLVELDTVSTVAFALGTMFGIGSWLVTLVWLVQHRASRLGANGQKIARRMGALLALVVAIALGIQASGFVTIGR